MYFSQPKMSFLKPQQTLNFLNKQNTHSFQSKVTVLPSRNHRTSISNSNIFLNDSPYSSSFSKDQKIPRNFSKNKQPSYYPKHSFNVNSINSSFNQNLLSTNSKIFLNNHRYSCNTDMDGGSSDQLMNERNNGDRLDDRNERVLLEDRVKELQQKMRKQEQNMRLYFEQIQCFKHQFSSTNLHDSINSNILTVSTKSAYKQNSIIGNYQNGTNNKENMNKNNEQVLNSLNQTTELSSKLKLLESMKKDIKKINNKDEIMKGQMSKFQGSVKEGMKGFKCYLEQALQALNKKLQKNRKKIFDKLVEQMDKKFNDFKKSVDQQSLNRQESENNNNKNESSKPSLIPPIPISSPVNYNIKRSTQKFLKDPILIKLRQQVYAVTKRTNNNLSPNQSYQDMIKRNIYQSLGVSSNRHFEAHREQAYSNPSMLSTQKISLEQSQTTYYIDEEGYLLDSQGYYLLQNDQKIKLNEVQIQKLKQNQILEHVPNVTNITAEKYPAYYPPMHRPFFNDIQMTSSISGR